MLACIGLFVIECVHAKDSEEISAPKTEMWYKYLGSLIKMTLDFFRNNYLTRFGEPVAKKPTRLSLPKLVLTKQIWYFSDAFKKAVSKPIELHTMNH